MRTTYFGDPDTQGMGILPVLPSRFRVNVTAYYDDINGTADYRYGDPLVMGHRHVCESGIINTRIYELPEFTLFDNGYLYIYFYSPDGSGNYYVYNNVRSITNGEEVTISFDIFEHAFYLTYAVDGEILHDNVLTSFDGQVCGVSECDPSRYEYYQQKEQYGVPVSAISNPTKNADQEGCQLEDISDYWRNSKTYSTVTTSVEIWSLE